MLADWIHHNQMCRVIQHMQKVEILSKLHTHTITPCWLWLSKQRTSFISVFPSSPPSSLPLCVFRPPSHGHVWTTAVFGICFLTANHREWVSVFVHSQSINHVGPRWQWDQWLTGSSWDGRRCHRKTRNSVCECEKPASLPFTCLGGFPFYLLHDLHLVVHRFCQTLITFQTSIMFEASLETNSLP